MTSCRVTAELNAHEAATVAREPSRARLADAKARAMALLFTTCHRYDAGEYVGELLIEILETDIRDSLRLIATAMHEALTVADDVEDMTCKAQDQVIGAAIRKLLIERAMPQAEVGIDTQLAIMDDADADNEE